MNKNLMKYVEFCIKNFQITIDWAINEMRDKSWKQKIDFCRKSITEDYNKCLGAIHYNYIWAPETISDEEFEKFKTMVTDKYFEYIDLMYEVL